MYVQQGFKCWQASPATGLAGTHQRSRDVGDVVWEGNTGSRRQEELEKEDLCRHLDLRTGGTGEFIGVSPVLNLC